MRLAASVVEVWIVAALCAAAAAAWLCAARPLAVCTVATAVAWPAWPLFGVAPAEGALSLLVTAAWPAVAVLAGLLALGARGRWTRLLGAALALALASRIVRLVSYEPFLDPRCPSACHHWPLLVDADLDRAELALRVATTATTIGALALSALAVRRLAGRAGWARLAPAIVIAAAAVVLIDSVATLAARPVPRPEDLPATLGLLRRLVALAVLAVVAAAVTEHLLARRRLHRLGDLLAGEHFAARKQLAEALGDPTVTIAFQSEDGSYVDAGTPPGPVAAGRRLTHLRGRRGPIATIEQASTAVGPELERVLGPRILLALHNESLVAQLRRSVDELSSSRRRVVAAADEERARLERDLHDGAQQRLLALALELQRGRQHAERAGDDAAADRFARANEIARILLERLRAVANGIHPASLEGAGLAVAVRSLAASSTVSLAIDVAALPRLAPGIERAAYALVRDAAPPPPGSVAVSLEGATLRLRFNGIDHLDSSVLDRVAAADGRHRRDGNSWEVELPCG